MKRILFSLLALAQTSYAGNAILESNFGEAGSYKEIPKRDFVSGSLPGGWKDESAFAKSNCVNAHYEKLADGKDVFFLDFGSAFLEPDGSISKDLLFDHVHCTPKGYGIYTDKLLAKVKELLGK